VLFALAALVVGAGLFAAAGLGRPVQTRGGTLRVSSTHDVGSLDPAIAYGTDSWSVEYATCAQLYNYPDRPGTAGTVLAPEVAADFPSVSGDGKTQTVELKRTYRFSNGARVTAANFVAAFNRDADPKLGSPATQFMREILGVDAVLEAKAKSISGIRAVSRYTLQIRTTRPVTDLPSRLALPFFCPIAVDFPPAQTDDTLGSGPYHLVSHVPNRQIVLERNRSYEGPRPANADRIVWTFAAPEACRQAADRNAIDHCWFVPPQDIRQIVARYGINRPNGRFFRSQTLGTSFFVFNHDRPAFKGAGQIPLKQAINLVLDRHALALATGYLSVKRTDQILPGALGRDEHIYSLRGVSARDLAKARALVAKAAVKPDKLVLYTHLPGFKGVNAEWAQIFRFGLNRLGIDVEIKYFGSFGELLGRAGTRGEPYDVLINGWNPDYPDGAAFFGPLLDGNNIGPKRNTNLSYFDRPAVNAEIERIEGLKGAARREAWADLDVKLMRDDPPWAPFAIGTAGDYVSKSLGCYLFQPVYASIDYVAACKK
jgi:ABC-type oligopeptide transport system substrate-binding subunit